ncbi:hypothetical protein DVH24_012115 [Malus domestica]|uniref:RNase H type-1 domain-containing protein n=1 Tax=Malus domestica TaxID=3750 RepID=A0A498HTH2_MALDO|nr:hypothetical protein DVH24_012115 [Malus domestica]
MRDCAFARCVWMASPIGFPPCPHRSSSSMDWIASWVAVLNPENFAICLMILWAIWGAHILASRCISWWQAFIRTAVPTVTASARLHQDVKWSRPRTNFLKINIDGAWNESSKQGGVGMINDRSIFMRLIVDAQNRRGLRTT